MIRRNFLKGFMTGVAALAMGRSAKAAPVKPKRYAIPIRPDDTLVAFSVSHKLRVLRSILITPLGPEHLNQPGHRSGLVYVAIKQKNGEEYAQCAFIVPSGNLFRVSAMAGLLYSTTVGNRTLVTFSSGGLLLDEGDTLVVYTWKSGRKVPVSYDAIWHEVGGGRTMHNHQSVRV